MSSAALFLGNRISETRPAAKETKQIALEALSSDGKRGTTQKGLLTDCTNLFTNVFHEGKEL